MQQQEVQTDYAYEFDESIDGPGPNKTLQMNGDGNQDIFDNQFCLDWSDQYAQQQQPNAYSFEAMGFSGVHHMQMYVNPQVMSKVKSILFADIEH